MVEILNHGDEGISGEIHEVFQASYRVEADLLGIAHRDFPPLKRNLIGFRDSPTNFYGIHKGPKLAAVIELNLIDQTTDICSLVVHPSYFRQGLARTLLDFAIKLHDSENIIVETGAANRPAIALYEQIGFKLQEKFMTSFGVEKVKFLMEQPSR